MSQNVYHTKVVIIGAGAAGLMAALRLSEKGIPVVVLEKGAFASVSNFATCGGPSAAGTHLQKEAGIDLTAQQLYEHMSKWANHTVNQALLREAVYCTGEAVDRMEALGIPIIVFDDLYGLGFRARHIICSKPKDRTMPIVKRIEETGGRFLWKTAAEKLLLKEDKVCGVSANDGNIQVYADAVLVCTGGFQGNAKLLRRFFGTDEVVNLGSRFCTGDGLLMMEEAGAVMDRCFALLGNEGGGTTSKGKKKEQNCCFALYGGLLTDRFGYRFMNEKEIADFPLAIGGEAFVRNGRTYAIVDSECYEACCTIGCYDWLGQPENWKAGKVLWYKVLDKAKETLPAAIENGWAWKAESVEELAQIAHLEHLPETVERYNRYCEQGIDEEFSKSAAFLRSISKAPYYCFEVESACWGTNGGVKTDRFLRVLNDQNEPIQGLYAAGVDAGSMYTMPYYNNDGASVGLALGSGIYAAKVLEKL